VLLLLRSHCRLEEAEERYRNREAREEDLALIEQLKMALTSREQEMQQLIVSYIHAMWLFVIWFV